MSPTARTLAALRRQGYLAAVVERWLPWAGVRQDLWGFGDLIACHPRDGLILIVQATTSDHLADRLAKARSKPELALWLKAGGQFQAHGWRKVGGRWCCRIVELQAEDLAGVEVQALPRRRRRRKGERQQELFED